MRGIKSLMGREGQGYQASLIYEGKKVATISDTADGGPIDIYWEIDKKTHSITPRADRAKRHLEELVKSLPPYKWANGSTMAINEDIFLDDLMVYTERANKLKKDMKKVVTIKDGNMYKSKGDVTPEALTWYRENHKDRIILNDIPLHDAIMACEEMSQ